MQKLLVFCFLGIFLAGTIGCSGSSTSSDDKELRKQLSKEKVDINDVPPSQRKMVQGFIDKANQMRAKAQANGK